MSVFYINVKVKFYYLEANLSASGKETIVLIKHQFKNQNKAKNNALAKRFKFVKSQN